MLFLIRGGVVNPTDCNYNYEQIKALLAEFKEQISLNKKTSEGSPCDFTPDRVDLEPPGSSPTIRYSYNPNSNGIFSLNEHESDRPLVFEITGNIAEFSFRKNDYLLDATLKSLEPFCEISYDVEYYIKKCGLSGITIIPGEAEKVDGEWKLKEKIKITKDTEKKYEPNV